MDNLQNQKTNLLKKIANLKNIVAGNNVPSRPTPVSPPKTQQNSNNQNNGSRGCGACSRKKNT